MSARQPSSGLSRRRALKQVGALALAAGLSSISPALAWAANAGSNMAVPHRVVTMSWELTETLLALGVVPIGMPLPDWYRTTIVEPKLPAGVVDIGLLYQPNFDVLQSLSPDLFVITPGHAPAKRWLERLAPTITLGMYMSSSEPYRALCEETRELAARLQRLERADALIAEASHTAATVRAQLAARPALLKAPVIVAELVDDRHLRVYGRGSLFDEMLAQLGVANAAHPRSGGTAWNTRAGFALVALPRLADVPQASLLLVGPVKPPLRAALRRNEIWQALPAVRERRVTSMPVIAPYGGLVSMQRFARSLKAALARIAAGEGGVT